MADLMDCANGLRMVTLSDICPGIDDPPHAEIARTGRWTYSINIIDGLSTMTYPWTAVGRARAERRARRKLAWYIRKYGTPAERWTVR